jgi:hypothetical protein
MAIIFPNTSIETSGSRLNFRDQVVQFVDNTQTVNVSTTAATWINLLTTSITTTRNTNKILVEYQMNHRNDFGQGAWCLTYHRILVSGPGVSNLQVMYSGHMGSASLYIGFYERQFIYNTTTAGTYTFTAQGLAFQGTSFFGTANTGATDQYLRLYEIGS